MAVLHGKAGKIDFGGAIASILGWTMTVAGDVADSSVMAASGWWKTFVSGFIDCTATVEANAMTEGSTKVGTNAALKLYVNNTNYFYMNTAVCIEQTETVSKDDIGKISYSFSVDSTAVMTYV